MKSRLYLFFKRQRGLLSVLAAAFFFTGCETASEISLTSNLWQTRAFAKTASPASPSRMEVFEEAAGGRVLVRYNEYSERKKAVQPRAYWLSENRETVDAGRRPRFVEIHALPALQPLPACTDTAECTNRATAAHSAYASLRGGQTFVICRPGLAEGPFELPVYDERSGITTKVILTPLAVAGDAAMIGAAGAFIAAYIWISSGAPH